MKRLAFVFLMCIFLFSCAPRYDILSYQRENIDAECVINGKYTVNIIKKEDYRALKIVEPSELCAVSFELEGSEWVARCEDVKIPMEKAQLYGICALCSIFDLDESAITTATDTDGIGFVDFVTDDITYTVSYNSQALPEHIKITGSELELDVEIKSIKILE